MARRDSHGPFDRRFLQITFSGLLFLVPIFWAADRQAVLADSAEESPIALINRQIRDAWKENGLRPSKRAPDAEWCRRVYLDLVGRLPTVEELDSYTSGKSSNQRELLVDRLLGSGYEEDFSRNWSTLWTNTLVGRTGGRERRSLINRSALEDYLKRSILESKPYDQLAVELITATGSTDPEDEDFSGAVNFLVEKLGDDGVQATVMTAQIFLGTAVQCTQCHNHPFNETRQNQFWELNAFYRQTAMERIPDPERENRYYARVIDQDFAGEGRQLYRDNRNEVFLVERNGKLVDRDAEQLRAAPIYYELRNGQIRTAFPVFVERHLARGQIFGTRRRVREQRIS